MRLVKCGRNAFICLLIILFIPLPHVSAIEMVSNPDYTPDDWFVYEGYSESLTAKLREQWEGEENFEGVTLNDVEELRVTHKGNEVCTILSWSGDCIKAEISHTVNISVGWQANTTNYDNDTLNMSITHYATHWQARGTAGWEKLDSVTSTTTTFSGGGEENLLEHELREVKLVERVGHFPVRVELGGIWDVEERVEVSGTERVRENHGLWSEREYNHSNVTQVAFRVLGERDVHYGDLNEKRHDTLAVERVDLSDNTTTVDFFRSEGFLARTERWHNGTLTLSATLVDYRYYVTEPHDANESTNSLMPILLACFAVLVVIGIGATRFGLSMVPKPRMTAPVIPIVSDSEAADESGEDEPHDPLDDLDL